MEKIENDSSVNAAQWLFGDDRKTNINGELALYKPNFNGMKVVNF